MLMINGDPHDLAGISVQEMLDRLGFRPERVVVERNEKIVPRDEYSVTILADNDTVEVVSFVGGG